MTIKNTTQATSTVQSSESQRSGPVAKKKAKAKAKTSPTTQPARNIPAPPKAKRNLPTPPPPNTQALSALQPPGPEDLYDVINERYEKGSILLTSNREPAEWPELFGDPLLASAGIDRLAHGAEMLVITGASYRARGRKDSQETKEVRTDR